MTRTDHRPGALPAALWPACTGALAIVFAVSSDGAATRRSAVAWMIGSWGARLAVQALFAPVPTPELPRFTSRFSLLLSSVLFSIPAFLASRSPEPSLSWLELGAAVLWMLVFAAETTADRQRLRFTTSAAPDGSPCRSGLWRFMPHAHAICDTLIWTSLALFASASPWGWLAWICPAARLYLLRPRY